MTSAALLSLGGNVGDRKATMDAAVVGLATLSGTSLTARSSYYRTEPVGPIAQAWFLNIAVALSTGLTVEALAAACREIEAALGRDRRREIPWGPRSIDIDVVAFGDSETMQPNGADLDARAFVLVALAEIAPAVRIGGRAVAEHAAGLDTTGIAKLDWPQPPA